MVEISSILATSVSNFIDYALWVTLVMIVYYLIRFAMGTEKKKKEEEGDSGGDIFGKIKGALKSKEEKDKKDKVDKERRHALEPALGFAIRAEENAAEAIEELRHRNAAGLTAAHEEVNRLQHNLSYARRHLRTAGRNLPREWRDCILKFSAYIQTIEEIVSDDLLGSLPTTGVPTAVQVANAILQLKQVRTRLGVLIKALQKSIDEGTQDAPDSEERAPRAPTPVIPPPRS
ncbi:hypothetical protein J4437_04995 [Candidatus Woesearchaeota archaeon]|nr:hypothetical protein [Candidatus Woesearchaeota archaeon]